MADVHSTEIRSFNMSRIRSKDTKPEMLVRRFLFSKGFRYKLHDKSLPGKPDIVLRKHKTVIFVNGCFWHCHQACKYFKLPKTNSEWWLKKLTNNVNNDQVVIEKLESAGWQVITVWSCDLKANKLEQTYVSLLAILQDISNG